MRHDYSDKEIKINQYILEDLIKGVTLAQYIKSCLDSKSFIRPQSVIDSIMDSNDRSSLMCYLIRTEQYEACAFLKDEYEKLIIGPEKFYIQNQE